MTRRRGQEGSIETSGKWMVVRFWVDVPGQEKRQHACERICPKSGPGLLSKSEQKRRSKEIIAASGCDTEEHFRRVVLKEKVVAFREQTEWWLEWLQTRNNKPIPQTSVSTIRSAIEKWLNPNLGDLPLSDVGNGAEYAEQIHEDNQWRQTLAAKVGLGFQIPAFVPKPIVRNVRKNRQAVEVAVMS